MSMKGVAGVLALLVAAGTMAVGAADACGAGCAWAGAGRPLINAHRGSRHEYDDNAAGGFRRSLAAVAPACFSRFKAISSSCTTRTSRARRPGAATPTT